MREQDSPSITNPLVEVDRALCRVGSEVGGSVVDPGNTEGFIYGRGAHIFLLYPLSSLKIPKAGPPRFQV
jgi:hypothetical protein